MIKDGSRQRYTHFLNHIHLSGYWSHVQMNMVLFYTPINCACISNHISLKGVGMNILSTTYNGALKKVLISAENKQISTFLIYPNT